MKKHDTQPLRRGFYGSLDRGSLFLYLGDPSRRERELRFWEADRPQIQVFDRLTEARASLRHHRFSAFVIKTPKTLDALILCQAIRLEDRRTKLLAATQIQSFSDEKRIRDAGADVVFPFHATNAEISAQLDLGGAPVSEPPRLTEYTQLSSQQVDLLRKVRQSPQPRADSDWDLAFACYRSKNFEEAVPLLRSVLLRDPKHVQAQYYLGSALYLSGELPEAAECWRQVVETSPRSRFGTKAKQHLTSVEEELSQPPRSHWGI